MIGIPTDIKVSPKTITNGLVTPTTFTFDLPASYQVLEEHFLLQGGLTTAMLVEARQLLNGVVVKKIKGADLDAINQYFGMPASQITLNVLYDVVMYERRQNLRGALQSLNVQDPNVKAINQILMTSGDIKDIEEESNLNCGSPDASNRQISSLQWELDFNNTPGAGNLQVTPFMIGQDKFPGGAGMVKYIDKRTLNATIGTNILPGDKALILGNALRVLLETIVLVPTAGTLTNFLTTFNNVPQFQRTDAVNRFIQQGNRVRFPQAGYYMLDQTERGYGDEDLIIAPSATDYILQFDETNAENVFLYQYSLGNLFPKG